MYRVHGFQDKDQLLEMLVKENSMTFFPEFNLLAVTSSPALFRGPMSRETAIFNVTASEISSGEFFKGCDYVSDFVFKDGRDKAIAIIDSYEQDSDGFTFHDRRIDMLSRLFSWSSTITASSIPDMVRRASYYQKHLMSNRESFELSHGKPLSEISERPVGADAKGLLDKLTSSETVSYFPEFNLLVTTTEYDPLGLHDRDTCVFNVFPSELAYEKLFHGFENVADIPFSGPVVDPIVFQPTFFDSTERDRSNDVDLGSLAMLLSGSDVISTQSVPELLETMADRFGIEPEGRVRGDRAVYGSRQGGRTRAEHRFALRGEDRGVRIDEVRHGGRGLADARCRGASRELLGFDFIAKGARSHNGHAPFWCVVDGYR